MTNSTTSDHKASKLQRLSNSIDTYVTIPAAIATGLAATVLAAIWFFTSLSIPDLSLLAIVIPAVITFVSMITSAVLLGPEHSNYTYSSNYRSSTDYSSSFDYPSYTGYVSTSHQHRTPHCCIDNGCRTSANHCDPKGCKC